MKNKFFNYKNEPPNLSQFFNRHQSFGQIQLKSDDLYKIPLHVVWCIFFAFVSMTVLEAQNYTHEESNGMVIIEMENTSSPYGQWRLNTTTDRRNNTGQGALEFTGNDPYSGPPESPLEYTFKVNQSGAYFLQLHCAKFNQDGQTHVSNDCYVRVDGNYEGRDPHRRDTRPYQKQYNGFDAPLSMLQANIKYYGGSNNRFVWTDGNNNLDPGGHDNKRNAVYNFYAGEIYTLIIHGRSRDFKINRILFRHENVSPNIAQNLSLSETLAQEDDPDEEEPVAVTIKGELKRWHKVTLELEGPESSEMATPNPFLDYRFNVNFRGPNGQSFNVPGYFATDGQGGDSGNIWMAHLNPNQVGSWSYTISFRSGTDVAVDLNDDAGTSYWPYDGLSGSFIIGESDKSGDDFRAPEKGLLVNRGQHYLTYESGKPFLYTGPGIPENILGYDGFVNTGSQYDHLYIDHNGDPRVAQTHRFEAHADDWNSGDPNWPTNVDNNLDGKNLIGALNYIAEEGANCIYLMANTVYGDAYDCFPHPHPTDTRDRYDLLKLMQWDIALSHAQSIGIFFNWHLSEVEEGNSLYYGGTSYRPGRRFPSYMRSRKIVYDGPMTVERKLYFRMLTALFGHYNALKWNVGEESRFVESFLKEQLDYLNKIDPYQHPITFQVGGAGFLYDFLDLFTGDTNMQAASFQGGSSNADMFNNIQSWRMKSANSGMPWTCAWDEPQTIHNDVDDFILGYPNGRRNKMWPCMMAGGDGFMWYIQQDGGGHGFDQAIEDFSIMKDAFNWSGYVRDFLGELPLNSMTSSMSIVNSSDGEDYTLYMPGHTYAIFNDTVGRDMTLNLTGLEGDFTVKWFDPRNGGTLLNGSVSTVMGGDLVNLGQAPYEIEKDWAILVSSNSGSDQSYSLNATSDFNDITSGDIEYYVDQNRSALAIDASQISNRGPFARASTIYMGSTGSYQINISTIGEEDGESIYKLFVNNNFIGQVTNNPTNEAFESQAHSIVPSVQINFGDTISVESNAVTNGLIPEGNGTAWARGRWTGLTLTPSDEEPPVEGPIVNSINIRNINGFSNVTSDIVIDKSVVGTSAFKIRAVTTPNNDFGRVEFKLTGATTATQSDTNHHWNFKSNKHIDGGEFNLGAHTLTVTPYNSDGQAGTPLSVGILVVDGESPGVPSIDEVILVDATNNVDIRTLAAGDVIDLSALEPGASISIRVEATNTNSVMFTSPETRGEEMAPYVLTGDEQGDYDPWYPNTGLITLSAIAYSGSSFDGTASETVEMNLSVIDSFHRLPVVDIEELEDVVDQNEDGSEMVTLISDTSSTGGPLSYEWIIDGNLVSQDENLLRSFELGSTIVTLKVTDATGLSSETSTIVKVIESVSSELQVLEFYLINGETDEVIAPLKSGDVIRVSDVGQDLNIRADVSGETVNSVVFDFNGQSSFRTENVEPYALFGDNSGDYDSRQIEIGTHTLRATPYSETKGGGEEGISLEISFEVIGN